MRGFCIRMEFCFTKKARMVVKPRLLCTIPTKSLPTLFFCTLIFLPKTRLCGFWQLIVHLYLLTCDLVEFLAHKCVKQKPWLRQAFSKVGTRRKRCMNLTFSETFTLFSHHSGTQSCVFYILKSYNTIRYRIYIYNLHACIPYNYISLYIYIFAWKHFILYFICAYKYWTWSSIFLNVLWYSI